MDMEFDTGDIIDTFVFPHHGMTANECYDALEKAGKDLLLAHLPGLLGNTAPRQKQGDGKYWKSPDWVNCPNICSTFFTPDQMKIIYATHFEGKQYPRIKIGNRDFELRAV
jgi:hypothetical protein